MRIEKTRDVKTPTRGTSVAAGIDFYVPNDYFTDEETTDQMWFNSGPGWILPGGAINIPTGILVEIPKGFALIAFNKSGVAIKKGLQVGACVIDEDYQGEPHIHLFNVSTEPVAIQNGEKLVQFILIPVSYEGIEVVDKLNREVSERGTGMAGSTDTK